MGRICPGSSVPLRSHLPRIALSRTVSLLLRILRYGPYFLLSTHPIILAFLFCLSVDRVPPLQSEASQTSAPESSLSENLNRVSSPTPANPASAAQSLLQSFKKSPSHHPSVTELPPPVFGAVFEADSKQANTGDRYPQLTPGPEGDSLSSSISRRYDSSPLNPRSSLPANLPLSGKPAEMISLARPTCVGHECSRMLAFAAQWGTRSSIQKTVALHHFDLGPRDDPLVAFRPAPFLEETPSSTAPPKLSLFSTLRTSVSTPHMHSPVFHHVPPAFITLNLGLFRSTSGNGRTARHASEGQPHQGSATGQSHAGSHTAPQTSDTSPAPNRAGGSQMGSFDPHDDVPTGEATATPPPQVTRGQEAPAGTREPPRENERSVLRYILQPRSALHSLRRHFISAVTRLGNLSPSRALRSAGTNAASFLRNVWSNRLRRHRRVQTPSQMARVVGTWLDKHEDDIKKGKKKLLFLMRHAESEFNEWRRDSFRRLRVRDMFSYDPNMQDVCLTDRGLQQCASAARFYSQFRAELPTVEVDAYIVSPLSRTIQTALNTFSCPAVSRDPEHRLSPRPREGELPENQAVEPLHTHEKWLLLPLVRERTDTTGDTGRKAEELRDHLEALRASRRLPPNCSIDEDLDWSLVNPLNKWWLQFADDEIAQIEEVLSAPWYDADARKHHHLNGEEHAQETLRPSGSSHGPASSVAGEQAAAQQLNKLESDGEETPLETEPESVRDQLKAALRDYSTDVHDLIREQAWAERLQASWRFRKVPLESSRAVRARMRLVLKAICSVKDARVVVIVGHSIAFRVLTSTPKMGNASMAPFALDCESKTITELH